MGESRHLKSHVVRNKKASIAGCQNDHQGPDRDTKLSGDSQEDRWYRNQMGPSQCHGLLNSGRSLRVKDENPELAAIKFLSPMWLRTQNHKCSYRKIKIFIMHISFCELRYVTETPGYILWVGTGSSHSVRELEAIVGIGSEPWLRPMDQTSPGISPAVIEAWLKSNSKTVFWLQLVDIFYISFFLGLSKKLLHAEVALGWSNIPSAPLTGILPLGNLSKPLQDTWNLTPRNRLCLQLLVLLWSSFLPGNNIGNRKHHA